MRVNTNRWNRIRYTLYSPGYDLIARYFREYRKKSIDSLEIVQGDRVLIVGAGTGLDLEFIPDYCTVEATDITPAMVDRINRRKSLSNCNVTALVMDGQALTYADEHFDKVVLHLILAVIPDPVACIKEAERVLKPGGRIVIFDKFLPANRKVSVLRLMLNYLFNLFFTDITRDFESIVKTTALKIITDSDAAFNGNFRIIVVEKP